MAFAGWPVEALEFFEGLESDNSRAYWQAHKEVYDRCVKGPMEQLLRELSGELVARSVWEGGGGAVRVELRPAPIDPSRPRIRLSRVDPALRLAAEEALAELGITPTPELVEAELRRRGKNEG